MSKKEKRDSEGNVIVRVFLDGERETMTARTGRPVVQQKLRDSEGRHYIASASTVADTDQYECLVFPAGDNYEDRGNQEVVASTVSIDAAIATLEDWLNGSGNRGDVCSPMQEFTWICADEGDEAGMAWLNEGENRRRVMDQLLANHQTAIEGDDPAFALATMIGVGMMLGIDWREEMEKHMTPEMREQMQSLPDEAKEMLAQIGVTFD